MSEGQEGFCDRGVLCLSLEKRKKTSQMKAMRASGDRGRTKNDVEIDLVLRDEFS
jgi:hypothetical protein